MTSFLPPFLAPGWLRGAIFPRNLARRASVVPLLPTSCPALVSFISKEGRDFPPPNFFRAFQKRWMELPGSWWAGPGWGWRCCRDLSSLGAGSGDVVLLKGKFAPWLLGFAYSGRRGTAGVCQETTALAACAVLGRQPGTRLPVTVPHLLSCSALKNQFSGHLSAPQSRGC